MKCLVTGGAGFIGSHLVECLMRDGHKVIILDNFSTGRKENLNHIKTSNNLRFAKVNIADYQNNLSTYFENIDWVFHLAALADIVPSIESPVAYHKTNVDGTVNVLEASRKSKIKRFVYAASSSCYGMSQIHPTSETSAIDPQYPYALTKHQGEQYVLHWGQVYKLPVVSLRLFNVYGPRSRTSGTYGAVIGTFLAQKLHNEPFTVVGDGSQSRDFIYVTDVVNAFVLAAKSNITNETFNVGTGKPQSINTLVKLLGGDTIYVPKRPGEPDKTQADIRKIKKSLGWKPRISFARGIKIMFDQIENWKTAPLWTPKKIDKATRDWFKHLG